MHSAVIRFKMVYKLSEQLVLQHLSKGSQDITKRWVNEAQEAVSSDNIMVQVSAVIFGGVTFVSIYGIFGGVTFVSTYMIFGGVTFVSTYMIFGGVTFVSTYMYMYHSFIKEE